MTMILTSVNLVKKLSCTYYQITALAIADLTETESDVYLLMLKSNWLAVLESTFHGAVAVAVAVTLYFFSYVLQCYIIVHTAEVALQHSTGSTAH